VGPHAIAYRPTSSSADRCRGALVTWGWPRHSARPRASCGPHQATSAGWSRCPDLMHVRGPAPPDPRARHETGVHGHAARHEEARRRGGHPIRIVPGHDSRPSSTGTRGIVISRLSVYNQHDERGPCPVPVPLIRGRTYEEPWSRCGVDAVLVLAGGRRQPLKGLAAALSLTAVSNVWGGVMADAAGPFSIWARRFWR